MSKRKTTSKGSGTNTTPLINRKQKRKEARKQKKELKQVFFKKRYGKEVNDDENVKDARNLVKFFGGNTKSSGSLVKDKVQKLKDDSNKKRKKMLKDANREEDKAIQKLSKQLNLTRKKGKKAASEDFIPKSFMEDGLGYILEACDSEKIRSLDINEESESDNESSNESIDDINEFSDDEKLAKSNMSESEESNHNDDREIESEEETEVNEGKNDLFEQSDVEDESDNSLDNDDDVGSDLKEQSEAEAVDENIHVKPSFLEKSSEDIWEDIYGRKRDQDGNVVKSKYIPPALRNIQQSSNDLSRLEKQLKGQLNRLAESNMQSICRMIEDLYSRNSRNSMNECLVKILKNSILLPNALTPERLVMEHAGLISILHANVGTDVGAQLTQKWIEGFVEEYEKTDLQDPDSSTKILDNYLYFASHLYAFHVFGHGLIFDIFDKLVKSYGFKDIELIILLLKCVGFNLRKDDPSKLKGIISDIQKKAVRDDEQKEDQGLSRTKFMLECLLAIKNNNIKKLPNYDPTYQVHLQKVLRNYLRPGADVTPLNVKLDDLLNADTRGRWWIVGSAWTGRELDKNSTVKITHTSTSQKFSDELLALSRKMRMNTDARKVIFCTMMSANDYMDAFERLSKIDLKSPLREQEIAFVLTKCCVREPTFNPFYAHLASKLASQDRKFRMSIQCSIWDRISAIVQDQKSQSPCVNLGLFTSTLIKDQVMTISCLKKIEFADMNKSLTLYLRTVIKDLLKVDNDSVRNAYFTVIADNSNLSILRESLRLFMHHFLLKSKKEKDPLLKSRVESAENALLSASSYRQ